LTTIAYKNGIIAYDSLCVKGHTIIDPDFNKQAIRGQYHIFYCGTASDLELFFTAWNGGPRSEDVVPDLDAIVWDSEEKILYNSSVDPEENLLWKIELDRNKHYAIGSGHLAALALMDHGMTAFEAVSAASKRDIFTGGTIKTFAI
jgi:hypothetical protein